MAGGGLSACSTGSKSPQSNSTEAQGSGKADVTLRIGPVLTDIAKGHTISTIGHSGTVPGPLIRLKEGGLITVDLFNDTDLPELVHWHGQIISADVDGAAEEKSMAVPLKGHLRNRLIPQPSGSRFAHTHVMPTGSPKWTAPPKKAWDYTIFGEVREASKPDAIPFLTLFHSHQQLHMATGSSCYLTLYRGRRRTV